MEEKTLVLEVYPFAKGGKKGWCAEGSILATNGNRYHAKVEISETSREDLTAGEGDEPEREEAVKELLDQLITLMENPILQPILPTSVKITLRAIKGTRRLLEKHRAGSVVDSYNLNRLQYELNNPVISGALRAQRLYGKC